MIDDQQRYSVAALLIFLVNFVSPPYATWDEPVWEDGRTDDGQYVPAGYEGREVRDFCESPQTTKESWVVLTRFEELPGWCGGPLQ